MCIRDSLYSTQEKNTTFQITTDGNTQVFNGKPDWVYEEEVLEGDTALWWSPKGDYLSFFKTNETEVNEFPIPYFVQHENDVYPEVRVIKYPKSGTPNPMVSLNIYDLNSKKTSAVEIDDKSVLITEVKWVGDDSILAKVTDRSSDVLSVILVDASNNASFKTVRVNPSEGDLSLIHI